MQPEPSLSVTVGRSPGGGAQVVLAGELDLSGAPQLITPLQEADRVGRGHVVIVMNELTFIDSAGIAVLARFATAGTRLSLRGTAGIVRRAIDISGIADIPGITLD